MTYKELQQALRPYKEAGQTQITLNSPKPILEDEYQRLTNTKTEETEPEVTEKLEEVETVGRTLVLAVDKKWFDMIASGEKREEYRKIKPYYQSRFNKQIDYIKFTNGYGNSVPSATVELLGISKGIPKPEWSEGTIEQGTEVFILRLGDIVDPKPIECSDCNGSEDEPLYNWEEDKLRDRIVPAV